MVQTPAESKVGRYAGSRGGALLRYTWASYPRLPGDLLPGLGVLENPGSCVVDILEAFQCFAGYLKQNSTAVVQTAVNEGMDEGLGGATG